MRSTDSLRLSWRSSSLTVAGSAVEVDDRVDALGLLVDLVGEPATAPDVDLLDGATALADDVEELVEGRGDGALLELGVEDDHQFVMTHADNPPPLDSAATVGPWQEGDKRRARHSGPGRPEERYRTRADPPNPLGGLWTAPRPRWSAAGWRLVGGRLAAGRRVAAVTANPHRLRIGAHVEQADPLAEAAARSADLVQFFLGDPQGWEAPVVAYAGGAAGLRADALAAGVTLYVHAPYRLNVASTNNRIRIPSRKLLQQHAEAAAEVGAAGLIVHGGHVTADDDVQVGFDNWRKTFERLEAPLPILIENTAGGDHAMARRLDAIGRLWDALDGFDVGFCLDTCHAWAGGIELPDAVDRVKAITGRIDLVHANDSKDGFDCGRDRHENFGTGSIDPSELVAVVSRGRRPGRLRDPGRRAGAGRRHRLPARAPPGLTAQRPRCEGALG